MTMAEMKLKIEELEGTIEEQKHLAKAVEVKDSEISKQTTKIGSMEEEIKKLKLSLKENEHLASAVQAKDLEITQLKESHSIEIEKRVMEQVSRGDKVLTEQVAKNKSLEEELEATHKEQGVQIANYEKFISSLATEYKETLERYNSLLKILQGTTDSHVELHGLSSSKLMEHFPQQKEVK